jgi:GntR family transcriptional regulator, transcriptional repressor for pyruvate dehydrogenase complex
MDDSGRNEGGHGSLMNALRSMIAAGGALPPERMLAERLNVKRHSLRRALQELRANGELEAPAGRRRGPPARSGEILVRDTNPMEVIELRIVLEPVLARFAALRASPLDISRIQRLATTSQGVDAGAADLEFHKAVAAGSRNRLAAELYALLRRVGTDARLRLRQDKPVCLKRVVQRDLEHRAVADAIAARDPDAAEAAMRAHLSAVQRRVLEQMTPGLTTASAAALSA